MVFLLTKLSPDPPRLLTNVNKKMFFLLKASLRVLLCCQLCSSDIRDLRVLSQHLYWRSDDVLLIIALHSCPGTTRGTAPWRWPTTRAAPPTTSPTPSAGRSPTGRGFVKLVTGFIWLKVSWELTVEVLLIRKWLEHASHVSGDVTRWNSADEDNFTQVGKESIIIFFTCNIFSTCLSL